jgi:hypothetical protein
MVPNGGFTIMSKGNVNFNGFSGSMGYMSNYNGTKAGGGFDWSEIFFFTATGINNNYPNEHTGYNNDLHGSGEGYSDAEFNSPFGYGWGSFYSPTTETFTLKSADVASAWDKEQTVKFTTYNGATVVANDYITVSIKGHKIDFANYGSDFTNITKVRFGTSYKYAVNTASKYGPGWQVVIDNIKATWNGGQPGGGHQNGGHHVAHGVLAAMAGQAHNAAHTNIGNGGSGSVGGHHMDSGFHSVITADGTLGHHSGGALTAEFHFGSW